MSEKNIFITDYDLRRLRALINGLQLSKEDRIYIKDLEKELEKAVVMQPQEIPPDVITMNSRVLIKDLISEETMQYWLVFPEAADLSKNKISILAPIGTALIGYCAGDVIEWRVPNGMRKLKVEKILYQPESEKNYNL